MDRKPNGKIRRIDGCPTFISGEGVKYELVPHFELKESQEIDDICTACHYMDDNDIKRGECDAPCGIENQLLIPLRFGQEKTWEFQRLTKWIGDK